MTIIRVHYTNSGTYCIESNRILILIADLPANPNGVV